MDQPSRAPIRRPAASSGVSGRAPARQQGQPPKLTSRQARKIRYTAVEIQEPRWRRWMLGILVTLAVLSGTIGWYRYLMMRQLPTRPLAASPPADDSQQSAARFTSPRAPQGQKRSLSTEPGGLSALPDNFSSKQLDDFLRSHPDGFQAFERRYRDHEVTWAGTVRDATRSDKLLGVEFLDSEGMRILAWCPSNAEVSAGASVRIRGRLTRWRPDGFVLDECQLL